MPDAETQALGILYAEAQGRIPKEATDSWGNPRRENLVKAEIGRIHYPPLQTPPTTISHITIRHSTSTWIGYMRCPALRGLCTENLR